MDDNQNPRRFPRYRVEISLTVSSPIRQGDYEVHGICRQISQGGVTAIVSAELSIGEMVNLRFAIPPDLQCSTLQAVVRWRDRLQHGFEFWRLSEELSTKIKALCDALREKGKLT